MVRQDPTAALVIQSFLKRLNDSRAGPRQLPRLHPQQTEFGSETTLVGGDASSVPFSGSVLCDLAEPAMDDGTNLYCGLPSPFKLWANSLDRLFLELFQRPCGIYQTSEDGANFL